VPKVNQYQPVINTGLALITYTTDLPLMTVCTQCVVWLPAIGQPSRHTGASSAKEQCPLLKT